MNSELLIREVRADDAPAVARLSGELGYPAQPDAMRRRIELLLERPDHVICVACLASAVVGWIDVEVARHLAFEPRAEIAGLVVSGAVRSRGIGRLLVARVERWAAEQGLTEMLVRSRSTREDAHRFYLREGYSLTKTSAVFSKTDRLRVSPPRDNADLAGIYISWPFCAQKCTYCNFASGVQPRGLEDRYLAALTAELANGIPSVAAPDTLYIGGGTPSGMEPLAIQRLGEALPTTWKEATLEVAPGSLTPERIRAWQLVGVNRVSLGVQSFVRAELARTGRRHDAATVTRDVDLLRAEGIHNISIDLIAGLPGQNDQSWQTSIDALLALNVPHASVYMLEVDDDSRLGAEILLGGKRYGAADVPNDDQIAAAYETAVDQLARHGILRYEISNFARAGSESLHNLKYWHRELYFGFGADAHSFDGVVRWQNVETATEYVEKSERGESIQSDHTHPNPAEEKFFVGLRLAEGVRPDASDWLRYGSAFERHLSSGMMESAEGRLRLTSRGIMISNEIFQDFLAA